MIYMYNQLRSPVPCPLVEQQPYTTRQPLSTHVQKPKTFTVLVTKFAQYYYIFNWSTNNKKAFREICKLVNFAAPCNDTVNTTHAHVLSVNDHFYSQYIHCSALPSILRG